MSKKFKRREFLKFLFTSGIFLTGAGSISSLFSGCEKGGGINVERVYDFLEHLNEAEIITPRKEFVKRSSFTINGESKEVLFEHPDSSITFKDVAIQKNASLNFGISINEPAWEKVGDGVLFEIILTDKKSKKHNIYSRYIDPKNNPDDRKWFAESIDLKSFEKEKASITFTTSSGPKSNNAFDWAGWSQPKMNFIVRKRIRKSHHTNIILITLDTTRADHLSCYGYHRKTSPGLDKIAQNGMQFLNAISPSPWTLPAHASLFTSLFPSQHGAISKAGKTVSSGYPLTQSDVVLAKIVKNHGYKTAGFVGGPFLKSEFGFSQGFETYDDQWEGYDRRANKINSKVFNWIERNFSSPFFLFINYFDPHAPYDPPKSFNSPFKNSYRGEINFATFGPHQIKLGEINPLKETDKMRAIDLYDSEILFMDQQVAELFQRLEDYELLDDSLVIITADHGESFGENDIWGHGGLPIESQVRIPLLIHFPAQAKKPKVVAEQVQLTAIYSTILKTLNIPLPAFAVQKGFDINLLNAGKNEENTLPQYTFAERFFPKGNMRMLRSNNWKYLVRKSLKSEKKGTEWIFDLDNDPRELKNLIGLDKKRDNVIRSKYSNFIKKISSIQLEKIKSSSVSPKPLSPEMEEQLKALGYVK